MSDLYRFDGETFEFPKDAPRLSPQLDRVRSLMLDGRWRTLAEIASAAGSSEASASARLRDLRKPRFGAFDVQRERVDGGLFRYRVVRGEEALKAEETLSRVTPEIAPEPVWGDNGMGKLFGTDVGQLRPRGAYDEASAA